jgi:dTDP-4-amino-4,6-dideoxygalactose transaminase
MKKAAKERLEDLAITGARPAFRTPLHVGAPNIPDRQRLCERFDDILDRCWLTNGGPYVQEFEKRVADRIAVRHCVSTCNGTLALEIAIRALGLTGEVIVPSFTFVATAHALQWQEITPVFCDIDPVSLNIDPAKAVELITPRTAGIIGVHLWGRPCDIDSLEKLARRRNLKLLFDASHAFGCTHQGRTIGSFGDAEIFSFHATKFVNAIEGGAILTNNDELAGKARLMRNFGFVDYDAVAHVGTNGKMNEFSAAMGITSLDSMARFIEINHANYLVYRRELSEIPGVRLLTYDSKENRNYQYIVVEIDHQTCGISRDDLVQVLGAEMVMARRYFHPGCHRMEPYRSYFPHAGLLLPVTERMSTRLMSLPTGTAVDETQIQIICRVIATAVANASDLTRKLAWRRGNDPQTSLRRRAA